MREKFRIKDFERSPKYNYEFDGTLVGRIEELANKHRITDTEVISSILCTVLSVLEEIGREEGGAIIYRDVDGDEIPLSFFNDE